MAQRQVLTAGGIVVAGHKILLIRHKGGGLAFAKGHIEQNESPEDAAIREVAEETGYKVTIISELGSLQRKSIEKSGGVVNKTVRLYMMSIVSKLDTKTEEKPIWIELKDALDDMQFIEEAMFLEQHIDELK